MRHVLSCVNRNSSSQADIDEAAFKWTNECENVVEVTM